MDELSEFWTDERLATGVNSESVAVTIWLFWHEELSPFFASPQALLHYSLALRFGLIPGFRDACRAFPSNARDPWIHAGW